MIKACAYCQTEFSTKRKDQIYCKPACKQMAYIQRKNNSIKQPLAQSANNFKIPVLKVVKGDLFRTIKRVQRTQQFWIFCHSLFWSTQNFSEEQQNDYKQLIAPHFKGSSDIDETFKELVERACIAKQYVSQKDYRSIADPNEWLNIHYLQGLSGTCNDYQAIQNQRQTIPTYKEGISLLSEAVLRYSESRNVLDIAYYREEFIKLKQHDLLQYYMNAVMHIQFIQF
jgi:hypothetical protein